MTEAEIQLYQDILHSQARMEKLLTHRDPKDAQLMISSTRPYVVDYKGRRHLFLFSANTLTLSLQDLGDFTVPQNTWVNIGFQEGLNILAIGQSSNVPIFVRATDELVP